MRIGMTLGDVNGVGPEVAVKALQRSVLPPDAACVLIGPQHVLGEQCAALGLPVPASAPSGSDPVPGQVQIWDSGESLAWHPGQVRADAARAAVNAVRTGVRACLEGHLDALVTAPLCKEGLLLAGIDFPGHTELLAEECGVTRFGMLLMGGGLRVLLATRHLPLRQVPDALTPDVLWTALELGVAALPWLGCPESGIGVCALNPHAGDGGAIGDEERDLLVPLLQEARGRGWPVEGPIPADVIFHQALQGRYGMVLAMYHDQGLGPLKMHAFSTGVNVTLGLPIVRTSPDHGTAFDIAGQGRADPSSTIAALQTACDLARRPNPWRRV